MTLSLHRVEATDRASIDGLCQVMGAVRVHDIPRWRETTPRMLERMLAVPGPNQDMESYLAKRDGEPVGRLVLELPQKENLDMAFVDIWVIPTARRQGIGRELFEKAKAFAGTHKRKKLVGTTLWDLPEAPAPDLAGKGFVESLGFAAALSEVIRRLDLSTLDEAALEEIHAKARKAAEGYRVVRWDGRHPEEYIDDIAYLDARLMTDAPMGDLEFEAPPADAQRVRQFQDTMIARDRIGYHTGAVHEETNKLVAWTTITKEKSLPWHGFQQITIVEPQHRGHRLGALVKMENLRFLQSHEPQITAIDTGNAADNSYMIAINEQMGFRPLYAFQNWQREI